MKGYLSIREISYNGAYRSAVLINIAHRDAFQVQSVLDALGQSRKMP